MKIYFTLFFINFCLIYSNIYSQTLWTGAEITFSKENYADWTQEENQDRITNNVWITRANNAGIFNIASETEYDRINRTSPADTEWANGSISDGIDNLTFGTWFESYDGTPSEDLNKPKVLHLISDDIYIDITFTSWTGGGGGSGTGMGGGFSYVRSTNQPLNVEKPELSNVQLFPNPTSDAIYLIGLEQSVYYELFNLIGNKIGEGSLDPNDYIDIAFLSKGIYILRFEGTEIRKVVIE